MLQNSIRRVDKHKPYVERPLKLNAIDQHQNPPQTPPPLNPQKQDEADLSKVSSSIVDLMPLSSREQSKRLLTYLAENEHIQIDD